MIPRFPKDHGFLALTGRIAGGYIQTIVYPRDRDQPRRQRSRSAKHGGPSRGGHSTPRTAGWDHVAAWYDKLVGDEGSDYHRQLILPAAIRLLEPQPGERFIDFCCGQGVLARLLLDHNADYVLGIDASAKLITAARGRSPRERRLRYEVADARNLGSLGESNFDAAACLMAVQDLDEFDRLFAEMARVLKPGGRAVIIMMHPCFRVPRQSSWGWDDEKKTRYRRIERYAKPMQIPIQTRPGADPGLHTTFHHHPLADYINALGKCGMAITAAEELLTHRRVQPGARSRGENRSAEEIPIFLALKAVNAQPIRSTAD